MTTRIRTKCRIPVISISGRHNIRPLDTIQQMQDIVRGIEGKRLRYDDLVAA